MTEDDVWFTKNINVDDLQNQCIRHKISLLKLGWLGNYSEDGYSEIKKISKNINSISPKNLIIFNNFFNDLFFYNKYKFFSILFKIGVVNNFTKRKYWTLNSILMGFWEKDYWLSVWKDADGWVDEKQQLRNATNYYRNHKNNPNFIARLSTESMKTTFQSTATNSYHKYGFDFDVNYFNHLINEAWYKDEFNVMQNFPNDFTIEYFINFFDEKISIIEFKKWVEKFKNQYRNLGVDVE